MGPAKWAIRCCGVLARISIGFISSASLPSRLPLPPWQVERQRLIKRGITDVSDGPHSSTRCCLFVLTVSFTCSLTPSFAMSAVAAAIAQPVAAAAASAAMHANVAPIAALLGRWVGPGRGSYPTIKDFAYEEELEFANAAGKPFVSYVQRTWVAGSARSKPMHEENGFLRFVGPVADRTVEMMISQCTGAQEILGGTYKSTDDQGAFIIELASQGGLTRTPSAKHPFVHQTVRRFVVNPTAKQLKAEVDMATENTPMTNHLMSTLTKQ